MQSLVWACMLVAGTASVAGSQERPAPIDPADFEARLAAIDDPAVLEAMAAARRAAADSVPLLIELGLIELRHWELTGDEDSHERSRRAFDRGRDKAPDSPWAHFGWALATAHGPDVGAGGAAWDRASRSWSSIFGLDDATRAQRALERALELDPGFARAAETLAELALLSRDADDLARARQALDAIPGDRVSDRTTLMQARVAHAIGDHDVALDAARAAAARNADPESLHALALALLGWPGREDEGVRTLFAALDAAPPRLLERVWTEFSLVADTSEVREWREADLAGRRRLLREFWDVRAGMAAMSMGERIAEHYRRLAVAHERYRRVTSGPFPQMAINQKWPDAPFDERGVMYIRHGEPRAVVRTAPHHLPDSNLCTGLRSRYQSPIEDGETWVYTDLEGANRVLNFIRCRGFPEYLIPYDVPCGGIYQDERAVYDTRMQWCGSETREPIRAYTRQAFRSESGEPAFEAALPFAWDLFAFRGAGGRTDLSLPVLVEADSLSPVTGQGGRPAYALALSVFVMDTIRGTVARADTVVSYAADQPLAPGDGIVAAVNIPVTPTDDAVQRIVVRDGRLRTRGELQGRHIHVPSFAGDSLQLSSIVLGVPGREGNWRRGETSLTALPTGDVPGGEFLVFYEVYNLPAGAPYRTELSVTPEDRNRLARAVVQLTFQDVARTDRNGVLQELRSIDTQLRPGLYRLRVRLTSIDTGAETSTERLFRVVRRQ